MHHIWADGLDVGSNPLPGTRLVLNGPSTVRTHLSHVLRVNQDGCAFTSIDRTKGVGKQVGIILWFVTEFVTD